MQSFKQTVARYSEQELAPIFHLWGMDGLTNSNRITLLEQRIKDPIAARFVWEYLSPGECSILYRTLTTAARSGVRRDATLKKLQMPVERFDATIAALKRKVLIWEDTTKIRSEKVAARTPSKVTTIYEDVALLHAYEESMDALYTAGKEMFAPKSDRSQMSLDKILTASYPADELDKVAALYGVGTQVSYYYSRLEVRAQIEEELLQPTGAYEILQKLDPALRDLLKWLCAQGGKATMQAVRQHTGSDDTTLYTMLNKLEAHVLAFDTFSEQERVLFIPATTLESLKQATTLDPSQLVSVGLVPLATPPQAIRSEMNPLLYDLAIIVGAVYQQNIEPTQAGTIPKRIANKIQPLLHGQPRTRYMDVENEYLEMIFNIAHELGILRLVKPVLDGVKPHFEPGPQLATWARVDMAEQTRQLIACWIKSFSWLDIRGLHFRQSDPYYWNPMPSRPSILEQLRKCNPGQWYSTAGLLQTIWDKDPFELRPTRYNMRPADKQKTQALRAKWNTCEGEVYVGLLASTLYELGIVALGYEGELPPIPGKPANPTYFMLTELGAAALEPAKPVEAQSVAPKKDKKTKADAAASPALPVSSASSVSLASNGHRVLILQPNFELLLLQPDMPTLYSVLPFAQVNQVEMVSRLTLTRASVLHGIENGLDIEQILHILEEHSQKEVPQNVAYTLQDWVKLYKDVRISQVLLLEVSSEAVADEVCTSPKLQAFNLRKLGPRQVIASNDTNLQDLRRILEKEGILVHISGDIVTRQNRYTPTYGR
ncbi:MAG: helicase-associated domain-containing protein [Ktedonobacteraceae bacterium]